jgi:hypothetical protein
VFSTWLYTGNGSTQTITTGIDLAGKGGMLWIKNRSSATNNIISDTVRGAGNFLMSNASSQQFFNTDNVSALSSTGFSVGVDSNTNGTAGNLYASWTFRKQPKFFDVVTYTGNGSNRAISHNLGSTPGCIIVKSTSASGFWAVYHRSEGATKVLLLNTTGASVAVSSYWNDTAPTSTQFTVGTASAVNDNGVTYVAYLFAHDAGGFGLTGTDNVISCGSTLGTSTVNLGYEPQWILVKSSTSAQDWYLFDNMRGLTATVPSYTETGAYLLPNTSGAEATFSNGLCSITATGFDLDISSSQTYIYIAIRRGPMKTPTTGTSVYEGTTRNGTGAAASISGLAFPPDAVLTRNRDSNSSSRYAWYDKLRGPTIYLDTAATDSEFTVAQSLTSFNQTGESFGTGVISNANGEPYINWQFRRAPGFFDVVCYTGNGTAGRTVTHNLGVAPELIIIKNRTTVESWAVYSASLGATKGLYLNGTNAAITSILFWNNTAPTSTVFSVSNAVLVNQNNANLVAYLFASCPGVSKVGSYTGTGTTLQIDCGFTGGARFVLIKRTDSTGDWYVWDSARGIVSGNDPYLLLNTSGAEVQGTDYVDTYSAGFEISSTAPAAINANGGSFIFLAIA